MGKCNACSFYNAFESIFIFSNTPFGAISACHIFTVLLTAAENVINIWKCVTKSKLISVICRVLRHSSNLFPAFSHMLSLLFDLDGSSTFVVPYFECQLP